MRKISLSQIACFGSMAIGIAALATLSSLAGADLLSLGGYRALFVVGSAVLLLEVYALVTYRLFLRLFPLRLGEIAPGSAQEFVYHVHLLFFLIFFNPVMRSGALPIPLARVLYQALGASLGENTYSAGLILDPRFVTMGANTLIGQGALLVPHVIENERLAHRPIRIGNNVTVGAHAVVLSNVTIDDSALVATGAIVTKGTHIHAGEVWGGVPARRLRGAQSEAQKQVAKAGLLQSGLHAKRGAS